MVVLYGKSSSLKSERGMYILLTASRNGGISLEGYIPIAFSSARGGLRETNIFVVPITS